MILSVETITVAAPDPHTALTAAGIETLQLFRVTSVHVFPLNSEADCSQWGVKVGLERFLREGER